MKNTAAERKKEQ